MNDRTNTLEIRKEVAKKIWQIAGISPEHGNAVMDICGVHTYYYIDDLAHGRESENPNK